MTVTAPVAPVPRMRAATSALAEALFSSEDGPPPAARLSWLCDELEDFLGRAGPKARLFFRLSLLAVSVLAPLMIRRLTPLRALPLAARTRALARLEESALALPLFAVKVILCILYYEHPDVAREIGYAGSFQMEAAS
jgi:hypothetical protein